MRSWVRVVGLVKLLSGVALVLPVAASEVEPSVQDIENARRCAAETRLVGYAFGEVRDSVRAGGTARAEALLSIAQDSLRSARSACRDDPQVLADLDLLAAEADALRRTLETTAR